MATGRCVSGKNRRKRKAKKDEKHDAGRAESKIELHALHTSDEALGLLSFVKMAKLPSKAIVGGDPKLLDMQGFSLTRMLTYQCTKTPPPPLSPSRMKRFVAGKCSNRFSSSTSSTSTTMCLKGPNKS